MGTDSLAFFPCRVSCTSACHRRLADVVPFVSRPGAWSEPDGAIRLSLTAGERKILTGSGIEAAIAAYMVLLGTAPRNG
jgi:hypothetical protein